MIHKKEGPHARQTGESGAAWGPGPTGRNTDYTTGVSTIENWLSPPAGAPAGVSLMFAVAVTVKASGSVASLPAGYTTTGKLIVLWSAAGMGTVKLPVAWRAAPDITLRPATLLRWMVTLSFFAAPGASWVVTVASPVRTTWFSVMSETLPYTGTLIELAAAPA